MADRGFDQSGAETFGMGWARRGGEALVSHLKGKGFTDEEPTVGGLASRGQRACTTGSAAACCGPPAR